MAKVWPLSLPQVPLFEGHGVKIGDNAVRFKPDVGPSFGRVRTTRRTDTVTYVFRMTEQQHNAFDQFYTVEIADGTVAFQFYDPLKNAPCTMKIEQPPTVQKVSPTRFNVSLTMSREVI